MNPTEEDLTLKLNVQISAEQLKQAQELVEEFRSIRQHAAQAETLLLAMLNDWEVVAK
jgi:hypothetical protein